MLEMSARFSSINNIMRNYPVYGVPSKAVLSMKLMNLLLL